MNVNNVKETFLTYTGNKFIWILFIIAAFILWMKMDKEIRKKFIIVILISIIFVFNDFVRNILGKLSDMSTYYRFLWLIPIVLFLSVAMAELITFPKRWIIKIIICILLIITLTFKGESYYFKDGLSLPQNKYGISNDVIQVCEVIKHDKDEENPVVVTNMDLNYLLRAYDASIVWGISRNAYMYLNQLEPGSEAQKYKNTKVILDTINLGTQTNMELFKKAVKKLEIDYFVISNVYDMEDYLSQAEFKVAGYSDNYCIYGKKLS